MQRVARFCPFDVISTARPLHKLKKVLSQLAFITDILLTKILSDENVTVVSRSKKITFDPVVIL